MYGVLGRFGNCISWCSQTSRATLGCSRLSPQVVRLNVSVNVRTCVSLVKGNAVLCNGTKVGRIIVVYMVEIVLDVYSLSHPPIIP